MSLKIDRLFKLHPKLKDMSKNLQKPLKEKKYKRKELIRRLVNELKNYSITRRYCNL